MNIQELFQLESWTDRLTELKAYPTDRTKEKYRKYFNGEHPILTDPERQDVQVTLYKVNETTGKKEENGVKTVHKTRKVLNYPTQLIGTLASFVFGNPPELILNNDPLTDVHTKAFNKLKEVWLKESRLDEHNKQLLRTVSIETDGAELFFNDNPDEPTKGKIKVLLLSFENGDEFYPFFNDQRDMEAFTRRFKKRTVVENKVKDIWFEEVWTKDNYYLLNVTDNNKVVADKETKNPYGKIPVVYYDQKVTEWKKIENLIDTIEKKESQLSDVNTRVGHAAVKITGDLVNMPDATSDVKVYHIKPSVGIDGKSSLGDVAYLESQTAPESVKLELERTEESLYKFTNIPNLYEIFKNASNESGKALKIRLFPINIIIDEKREIYAPGLDRRVSVLKNMLYSITGQAAFNELDITVRFKDYIPEDEADTIDKLMTANGNKPIISQEKAVEMSGLVKNAQEEYTKIKDEADTAMAAAASFNPGLNNESA